jgi:hypothetical protein
MALGGALASWWQATARRECRESVEDGYVFVLEGVGVSKRRSQLRGGIASEQHRRGSHGLPLPEYGALLSLIETLLRSGDAVQVVTAHRAHGRLPDGG